MDMEQAPCFLLLLYATKNLRGPRMLRLNYSKTRKLSEDCNEGKALRQITCCNAL